MNYAIIKSGIVDNIVEWDGISKYEVDGQLVLANDDTYIGGAYTNNAFVPMYTQEELDQMEAEAQADAEAREALRQSMISKLATTLTPEETALLEELL